MPLPAGTVIRPEEPRDYDAIAVVVTAAFGSPAEAGLVAGLREVDAYRPALALVAVVDGDVVGHTMVTVTPLETDGGERREVAMLSPLAVEPAWHGQGIGSALVREVVARADDAGHPAVVLEGSPAFYGRLGFEPSSPLGIELPLPAWAPPEAAQVHRLGAYDPALRGRVRYPAPFDELEG
jgi:putative acetyltransferase